MSTTVGFTSAKAPQKLGRYEMLRRLAMGGMAEIYLARQGEIEGYKTLLVVKRILPHLAEDEEFIAMFLDEARLAAGFDHPNVVRIVEVGRAEGEYFIAMELVQGESLSTVLRQLGRAQRRMQPRLAAAIVAQAAAGLHYAHTATDSHGGPLGVVHRDVSPQNILVSFEGAVKVIDFGVARALNRITKTQGGGRKGKVGYLAPEQGSGDEVDPRTDVFALGIVLWETVTGTRLFNRDSDLASFKALMEDSYPHASSVTPVPPELDAIIDRALAKKPADRFPSALALHEALEKFAARDAGGKAISQSDIATFMKENLEEQHARWRDLVKSALSSSVTPGVDSAADLLAAVARPEELSGVGTSAGTAAATSDFKNAFRSPAQRWLHRVTARLRQPISALTTLIVAVLAAVVGSTVVALWPESRPPTPPAAVAPRPTTGPTIQLEPVPSPPTPTPTPPDVVAPVVETPPEKPRVTARASSRAGKRAAAKAAGKKAVSPAQKSGGATKPFKPNPF